MLDRLHDVEARYSEISERLADPSVMSDISAYSSLMKEYKRLTPVVEKFREYKSAEAAVDDALSLLASENDPDMLCLADEELRSA